MKTVGLIFSETLKNKMPSFHESASHSSLELFDKISLLEHVQWFNIQQTFPINSLNEASIEFQLETDRNIFLDLQEIALSLKFSVLKGNRKIEDTDDVYLVNNFLHSLFSNVEVFLNNEQVHTSNGLYPHKAFLSNELSGTKGRKEAITIGQGYTYEANPNDKTAQVFIDRKTETLRDEIEVYGPLAVDLFTCGKLLLPNVNVRIRLIRSRPQFYLFTDSTEEIQVKITAASLFSRQVAIDEHKLLEIKSNIRKQPAAYNYIESVPKTYIIPKGQNQFIQENIFNNGPIRSLAIAMQINGSFTGQKKENPFNYRKFGLREVKIVRGNQTVIEMKCEDNLRPFVETMKALKFTDDGPGINLNHYENHYVLAFDLTSMQESNVHLYYPDVVAASLRLELYFSKPLTETIEVFVLGEKLVTTLIHETGTVTKHG